MFGQSNLFSDNPTKSSQRSDVEVFFPSNKSANQYASNLISELHPPISQNSGHALKSRKFDSSRWWKLMEPLQIREPKFDTSSFKSILSRATTCFAFCQPEPVIPTSMQGAFRHGVNLCQQNVGFGQFWMVLDGFGVIRARKIFRAPRKRTFNMGCDGMPWGLAPPPLPQVLDRRCCYFHRRTQSAPASVVIAMDLFPVSRCHRSSREMIKTFQRSLEIQGGFLRSPEKMMAMRLATSSNSGSLDAIAWAHKTVTSLSMKWSQDSKSGCHRCVANIRLRLEWCPWSSMFFSNFVFIVCTVASIVSNRTASEHHKSGTCLFAFRSSAPHYQPSGSNHQTFPSLQRQTPVWSVAPTVPPGSRYLAGTFKYQNRAILQC